MIFETHAHYDDDKFTEDRDELILAVHESGVHPIINVGAYPRWASPDNTAHCPDR